MSVLQLVKSGGQTGVDVAALRAAKALGIATGGHMPHGWQTRIGPKPEYRTLYGMYECQVPGYPTRTRLNVNLSDATLRLAVVWSSPGEQCTAQAIQKHKRPYFDLTVVKCAQNKLASQFAMGAVVSSLEVRTRGAGMVLHEHFLGEAAKWLRAQAQAAGRPIVLNVAGNSEQTAPGIEAFAEKALIRLFAKLLEGDR